MLPGFQERSTCMKTMDDLIAESRDRAKARFAERKEIASKSLQLRIEGAEVRRRVDEQAPGFASTLAITDEAISTAERLIHTLDSCTERMEYLRLELIQIALGER